MCKIFIVLVYLRLEYNMHLTLSYLKYWNS